jgi:hypothetical protein
MDGSENFNRGWNEYVSGFGKLCREHWLGLDKIHCLATSTDKTELRIDMEDFTGAKAYAYYNTFTVGDADSNYELQVAGYCDSGRAGDSLQFGGSDHHLYNNGMPFSTHDKDNDKWSGGNCAQSWRGGWWYKQCMGSQLNGIYHHNTTPRESEAVLWRTFIGTKRSLKFAEMKLRAGD